MGPVSEVCMWVGFLENIADSSPEEGVVSVVFWSFVQGAAWGTVGSVLDYYLPEKVDHLVAGGIAVLGITDILGKIKY